VKKYDVPGLKPVIVNELSFAPGWFAIVQLGSQVTVKPVIPAPTRVGADQFRITDVVDSAVALSPVTSPGAGSMGGGPTTAPVTALTGNDVEAT
jgi:uncharacterized protein (DUF1786 family)